MLLNPTVHRRTPTTKYTTHNVSGAEIPLYMNREQQYKYLFMADGIELEFDEDAKRAIAKKSIERKTGARGLRSIVEASLRDIMFTAPSDPTISKITVTADCVEGTGEPVIERSKKAKKTKA